MNKTYKLFGSIWDHLETSNITAYINDSNYFNYIESDINLFDLYNIRKINLSTLLSYNTNDELVKMIKTIKDYKSILINLDYIPVDNKIVRDFFKHRINQIYTYINNNIEGTVYLSNNYNEL